jgi:hypothetical protein
LFSQHSHPIDWVVASKKRRRRPFGTLPPHSKLAHALAMWSAVGSEPASATPLCEGADYGDEVCHHRKSLFDPMGQTPRELYRFRDDTDPYEMTVISQQDLNRK